MLRVILELLMTPPKKQPMEESSPDHPALRSCDAAASCWSASGGASCPTAGSLCAEAAARPQTPAAHPGPSTLWSHSRLNGRHISQARVWAGRPGGRAAPTPEGRGKGEEERRRLHSDGTSRLVLCPLASSCFSPEVRRRRFRLQKSPSHINTEIK